MDGEPAHPDRHAHHAPDDQHDPGRSGDVIRDRFPPPGRAGERYRAVIRFTGPVREARVGRRLPVGLTWRSKGNTIVVRGKVVKPSVSRFAAVLSGDGPSVRTRFRLVVR